MVEMAIGNLLPALLNLITLIGGLALMFGGFFNFRMSIDFIDAIPSIIAMFSGVGLADSGPTLTALIIKEKTSKFKKDKEASMDTGGWQEALYKNVNVNQAWTYGMVKELITVVEKLEAKCDNIEQGRPKNGVKGLEDVKIQESTKEDITSAISF